MGTTLNSIDNMLASAANNGLLTRAISSIVGGATTAALTTCGSMSVQRHPSTFVMPSVGAGLTGAYFPYIKLLQEDASAEIVACLEYSLGTLAVSGNVFSDGVAMPTKLFGGAVSSVVTATQMAFLVVTAALTATTPTVTITYTDQDGNTNQTATLVLPTSPALNTAFMIHPHLASGDSGIRDVTNISISAGSAGSLAVKGCLLLSAATCALANVASQLPPLAAPIVMWLVEAGEVIAFYRLGITTTNSLVAVLSGVAEN